MLGKTFSIMCVISITAAVFNGRLAEMSSAVFDGAARAVTLTLELIGMMCLWNGVMNVLKEAGAIAKLAGLISPILKFLYPRAYKSGNGINECAANMAANLLGIGNAATPLAITALEKMQLDNEFGEAASDDMIMLAVINCSPLNLLPITLMTLRKASGSVDPGAIMVPVWIGSLFGAAFSIALAKVCARLWRNLPEKSRRHT